METAIEPLAMSSDGYRQMEAEVERWAPEEACGLLAGKNRQVTAVYPITNALHRPDRFRMDPLEQLRAFEAIETAGLELLAIYHSHPRGPAFPSETDLAEFAYPGVLSLIWSRKTGQTASEAAWQARCFILDGGHAREISVNVWNETG